VVILYWFLKKKDTFVSLSLSNFTPDRKAVSDILGVGLPAGAEFLVISALTGILNAILVMVGGTDAVAVYTSGWRVVMMAIIPIISVGTATIAIVGANYGARKYENITIAHHYSMKVGLLVALVTGVLTYVFAYYISLIFAYSSETTYLVPTIAAFLQVMCLFYFFMPPGVMSSSVFQGVGKGTTSLVLTVLREIVFVTISAYVLAVVLGYGEQGVWWGIVIGNIIGSIVAYVCARFYIGRLKSQQYQNMTLKKASN
jgi:Na+-driven multidrug efflux pump